LPSSTPPYLPRGWNGYRLDTQHRRRGDLDSSPGALGHEVVEKHPRSPRAACPR